MNLAHEPKPLALTPRDEEILATIYRYRFVTSLDIAHLHFSPTYISYVRSRLARLSGKKDLEENTYLCRFKLPDTEGNRERVFTLGNKGREFAREILGNPVDWYFRPNKLKFFSHSAILHHLLVTRFISAAAWVCRSRDDLTLLAQRVSYEFLKNPPRVTLTEKNKKSTLTVIPDAWLLFGTDSSKHAVLFELDRGMEYQEKFKQHVRGRVELIRSGTYQEIFGVPGVIVSYVTTGQTPEYRTTRMKTMNSWTQQLLAEMNLKSWGTIFRFASVAFDTLYLEAASLFAEPVWLRPDTKAQVRLFE